MESKTLNQIFAGFEQFASNHPQINSYDLGTELKLDIAKEENFAKFLVVIGPAVYNNPSVSPDFAIWIVDKILTDKKNQTWYMNEVMSDTMQICTDFVAWLKINKLLTRGATVTFNPVIFQQDNQLAGWNFNVTLSPEILVTSCYVDGLTPVPVPNFTLHYEPVSGNPPSDGQIQIINTEGVSNLITVLLVSNVDNDGNDVVPYWETANGKTVKLIEFNNPSNTLSLPDCVYAMGAADAIIPNNAIPGPTYSWTEGSPAEGSILLTEII